MSVIQNAVRGLTTVSPPRAGASASAEERRRVPDAAAREHRVRGDELIEAHFGVAQRDAEAVVGRAAIEGREARARQKAQQRAARRRRTRARPRARSRSPPARAAPGAGRDTARRSCAGCRARPAPPSESSTGCRRARSRGLALLEGERIRERLERGSRLPRHERAVERAAVVRVEVVARPLPGEPLAARVVEHDHRDVRGAVRPQRLALVLDDPLDLALEIEVQRRDDARWPWRARRPPDHLDEMRRAERRASAVERHLLGARLAQPLGAQRAGRRHPAEHGLLPRLRGRDVLRSGLKALGRCGSAARNAAWAGVSIDGSTPKYNWLARAGAGGLVAVGRQVQVHREDLALGEAVLEPQREHHLADLRAEPRGAARRRAAGSAASRPAA